jgi:hypothetical protein
MPHFIFFSKKLEYWNTLSFGWIYCLWRHCLTRRNKDSSPLAFQFVKIGVCKQISGGHGNASLNIIFLKVRLLVTKYLLD